MQLKEKILIDLTHRKNAIKTEISFLEHMSNTEGLVKTAELKGRRMSLNEIIAFVEAL